MQVQIRNMNIVSAFTEGAEVKPITLKRKDFTPETTLEEILKDFHWQFTSGQEKIEDCKYRVTAKDR